MKNILKSVVKFFLLLVTPLMIVFVILNSLALLYSFITWNLIDNFYIPLNGGELQNSFDRVLIFLGVVLSLSID
jgi:hypothetical protein